MEKIVEQHRKLREKIFDRMFSGSKSKKDDGTRSQADRTMKKYAPKKWASELKRRKEVETAGDDSPKMKTHSHKKSDKGAKNIPHTHTTDHTHKTIR